MWKTVAKEEKRVKDLFENAKRRAQRRRAFYDSRLGDPMQLLRVSGGAVRLATNPETYTFNEDPRNLMPWASDPSVKIDRFDGRALLDYLPSTTPATIESGLRLDRDEDSIGNELRFERWHDLVDKTRLHVSEEQCLADNEEEWNDLVAKHHALIGKVPEKKLDDTDAPNIQPSFAFNYGTEVAHNESLNFAQVDRELTALEEENIMDHLDDMTYQERDALDALGAEYYIRDYYRLLRHAKQELDARVVQLRVTAVNLERTLAGKKPLKSSEIEGLLKVPGRENGAGQRTQIKRRGHRHRSSSPAHRSIRRSSPSYEPYRDSSSRSSSESPKEAENVEFIMEFSGENVGEVDDSWMGQNPSSDSAYTYNDVEPNTTGLSEKLNRGATGTKRTPIGTIRSNVTDTANTTKLSLAEKLKQRMRQGLDKSIRSNEIKRQVKEREQELSQARQKGDILSGQEQTLPNLEKGEPKSGHGNPSSLDPGTSQRTNSGSYGAGRGRSRSRTRGSRNDSLHQDTFRRESHKRSRSRSHSRSRNTSRDRARNSGESYREQRGRHSRQKPRMRSRSLSRRVSQSRSRSRSQSPRRNTRTHRRSRSHSRTRDRYDKNRRR